MSRLAAALVAALVAIGVAAKTSHAAPGLQVGLYDEGQVLFGDPDKVFPVLAQLHVQVLRVSLYWGGPHGVAKARPASPTNPNDPAYDWSIYDRADQYAHEYGMALLLSVVGTPAWANGGRAPNVAPASSLDLRRFAYAAARRYSGGFLGTDGRTLPPVRLWLAWNEPNNPVFLTPQFRKVAGSWRIQSATDYAKICQAVYNGVHATKLAGEKVACGGTSPRGNNLPSSDRPSVSPLAFIRALAKAGLKQFDAYAHHPYYSQPQETPATTPPLIGKTPPTAVILGNIKTLISQVTSLWGPRRIWITEYGYQTNPPDKTFGVSWAKQAAYLKQAYAIARANPRIDMMLWFLLRDEAPLSGWQSGLITVSGAKKPAFGAFQQVAALARP